MGSLIVGGASLVLNKEWTLIGSLPLNASNLDVVYGGQIGDASNELTAEQAQGKLVVLTVPLSNAGIGAALSRARPLAPASAAAIAVILPS